VQRKVQRHKEIQLGGSSLLIYGVFAKCWFPKAVEIRVLPGARLLANSFLTCPLFLKKSRWLNSLSLFPKIVPSLTASAYFFEVEEDSGKGQKQVRNTKKAALA
jgi:hypothetical protein